MSENSPVAMNIDENFWQPPARPDWVSKANQQAAHLDLSAIVPLNAENLMATAMENTGLADFGADDWREPFQLLVKSLDEEADLNYLGRTLTRGDLLRTLEGRLHIEAAFTRHPEINDEILAAPLVITGAARTGTTALYNLLAADPENRAPLLWETWFPHPVPEEATYKTDSRIGKANGIAEIWDEIEPEFPLLHKQHGELPVEDNYLLMFSFRGPCAWLGKTPSYIQWLAGADLTPALDYMKRVLKYLQWKYKCKRWVLKSPALTVPFPLWFQAFPDAMVVYTHRDPVKLTASSSHLLNMVFWLRSDNYKAYEDFYTMITNDQVIAGAKNAIIDMIENGTVPKGQIYHLLYKDFVEDNVGAVKNIYQYFGIDCPQTSYKAMADYAVADARHRASQPSYQYKNPSADEVVALRKLYGRYQQTFQIPNEL